jgi:hypothetical protein
MGRGGRRRGLVMLALAGLIGSQTTVPDPVAAAFPGRSGLIAWTRDTGSGAHVWTMRPDGTGRTDLGAGQNPAFSPDGARILYVDATGLGVMDADGSDKQHLLDGLWTAPAWSPDGTKIAVARDIGVHDHEVFVANADGSDPVDITNAAGDQSEPSWSPDGTRIAFWTNQNGIGEIWTVSPDGSNPVDVSGGATGYQPDWSPDGSKIAYVDSGIWVMAADGSDKKRLTGPDSDGQPAWSPDGSRIVFTTNRDGNQELYTMATDGTGQTRLTKDAFYDPKVPNADVDPSWQPRGFDLSATAIAFGSTVVATATTSKTVTLANGPKATTITSVELGGPDAAQFEITSDGCGGTIVAPTAVCSVAVRFHPTTIGPKSATLTFTGTPMGTAVVALSGTGSLFVWGSLHAAGPAYTWNDGDSLAATASGSTTYLHATYTTDRVGGKWVTDTTPKAGVYYLRSSNAGATWTTPKRLNPTTQHGSRGTVAASGSYVYATWVSTTRWVHYSGTAPRVLYFRRNTNHGSTTAWGSTVRLTSATGRVDFPVLAATGSYVFVAYTDSSTGAVKVARSANRGATWTTVTVGSTSRTDSSGRAGLPEIAASGPTVAVTWLSDGGGTAKVRISTTNGATWGAAKTVSTTAIPDVAVLGSRVAFVWRDGPVRLMVSTAGVWGPSRDLPMSDGYAEESQATPAVALFGSTSVGIAYSSTRTGAVVPAAERSFLRADTTQHVDDVVRSEDLIWRESLDDGATWAPSDVLAKATSQRAVNDEPSIAWRTATRPYVLWNGWTPTTLSYRLYVRAGA